jgi:hypothetical protein
MPESWLAKARTKASFRTPLGIYFTKEIQLLYF